MKKTFIDNSGAKKAILEYDTKDIKSHCVACGKFIGKSEKLFIWSGNYCSDCCRKASKHCPLGDFIIDLSWRRKKANLTR